MLIGRPFRINTDSVLRAAIVTSRRALTRYEEIHPQKKYANPKLHLWFLKKLKSMLDEDIKPIIISDNLYRYKAKKIGRKSKTKRGNIKKSAPSLKHAKGNKEPWLLVSLLPESYKIAKKVVKIYALRMQIEEGFRDLKSTKYEFGFEHVNTNHIYRLNVFFLIAMLATFLAWMIGWLAENGSL